jgi:hypothetical protein
VARAGVEHDRRAGGLQRLQFRERLFGDDAAGGGAEAVGGGDGQHPGAALHAPDAHLV